MNIPSNIDFKLPPEEQVMARNRAITTHYAQLYQLEPHLFKWTAIAAFASFHIGEKLKIWEWDDIGISSFSATCDKPSRSIEDDFQIIRIINNRIFNEVGWMHMAFAKMDYPAFHALLL